MADVESLDVALRVHGARHAAGGDDPIPGVAMSADLADVATTGAYADLAGAPPIPSTAGDVGAAAAGSVAVDDATDETDVVAQLNALLAALRTTGAIGA